MVGSVIDYLAILNEFLHSNNSWEKYIYKAYVDGVEEKGHELWAEYWSHERLQQRKEEIGSWAFYAEYMNTPISNENAPIRPEFIRYWKELPRQLSAVIAVDPAYSEEQNSDYKVASIIGIDQNNSRYLMQYVRTHSSIGDFYDAIINLWLQNKPLVTAIGIPNSGVEKSFFSGFMKRAEERKLFPPVQELSNSFLTTQGKSIRSKIPRIIAALQPIFQRGQYYIHESHKEAKDELISLGASRWDDLVDTMAYAEQILAPIYMNVEDHKPTYSTQERTSRAADYGI
jgi:phage terminase large subunit-like protein